MTLWRLLCRPERFVLAWHESILTMAEPDFFGCDIKLHRVRENVDALYHDVLERVGWHGPTNAVTVGMDFNSEMTEYHLWVESVPRELVTYWGVLIGEALHNIRSALDHLAWQLVITGSDPSPRRPSDVQFPIYDTSTKFDRNVDRRLPGVIDDYRTLIKGLQPYERGKLPEFQRYGAPLGRLARLSNRDKHQVVTPVLLVGEYRPRFECERDCVIRDVIVDEGPLKVGAEFPIVRVLIETTGTQPQMAVKGKMSFQIALEDGQAAPVALTEIAGEAYRAVSIVSRVGVW